MNAAKRIYLISHWMYKHKIRIIPRLLFYINQILFSCSLPQEAEIHRSVRFCHNALGIVIHGNAKIGEGTKIFQHVTVGSAWKKGVNVGGVPQIGKNVFIGAGACILGEITIGDGALIGANAVVFKDIPAGATVVGASEIILKKE